MVRNFSFKRNLSAKISALVAALFVLLLFSETGTATAQETLQSLRFKEDPRVTNFRQRLFDDFDAQDRPLSFAVNIYGMSRNEGRRVSAVAQRYILDLRGTRVARSEQFEMRFTGFREEKSENGYYITRDFTVTVRDARSNQNELIAQSALTVQCSANSCRPTMDDLKELFLRLGD